MDTSDLPPFWWTRELGGQALCLLWCSIPESGVDAPSIVVAFDVGEQVAPGMVPRGPASLVDEFDFQRMEEALQVTSVNVVEIGAS